MSLYWVPVAVFVLTVLSSLFFLVLHLSTQEPVPMQRARACYRWAVVVALATFDWWIFSRVVRGLIGIWWPASALAGD